MVTDEVHAAVKTFEQPNELFGMARSGVIDQLAVYYLVLETDIFEADSPLVRPVVMAEERNNIGQGESFLRRHDTCSLCGEGVMERDSQMAVALIQETLHGRDAHRGDRDALGRPCTAVRCSENLQCPEDIIQIIHRFTFAHENDICETALPFL